MARGEVEVFSPVDASKLTAGLGPAATTLSAGATELIARLVRGSYFGAEFLFTPGRCAHGLRANGFRPKIWREIGAW